LALDPSGWSFAGVWTNTCCSHQLYGQTPNEVDSDADIASGAVPGAKAAAVRKLQHELGIDPEALPASSFTYLTRLHYCAADTDTHGPASPWGEHEVDYILLAQADVELAPNPEEVQVRAGLSRGREEGRKPSAGSCCMWDAAGVQAVC
jgi:isopentenyl-diphosphate delta-isomerase